MPVDHYAEDRAAPELSTHELLNGLPHDLTLRFFATFARFEFAMKYCNCLKPRGAAEGCRRRLEERLPADFFEVIRQPGVAATLINRPAKNLLARGGAVPQFGDPEPPLATARQLLDAVWRVRNNLFHGNKLSPADRARDEALMTDVLAVIYAILERDHQLSVAFHEPQEHF
ncbi:hypothetical protein [Bradyrhizobium sp. WSM1417]|uniref:hypothetical protein n=1 Tax=Bradyrhizobium sp. WSM1417 TaxID=754500 RepID=UPI000683FBFA|nr:hypothetical protein [Bradyrhizobium sp. WSM1417]